MSRERALEKAKRYCAYQERCQLDVTNRFIAWNVVKSDWDNILDTLFKENYLNETRYIEAFVRGKFAQKKWGRNKIKAGLMNKRLYNEVSFDRIFEKEIEMKTYRQTLKNLIEQKGESVKEEDPSKKRDKIYRYMLGKGYESDLVAKELNLLD